MNEPTGKSIPSSEQRQWFWEQCGFRIETEVKYGRSVHYWIYPHKHTSDLLFGTKRTSSAPSIDLNNLFKYAVPKLIYFSLAKMEKGYQGKHWISEARVERDGRRYYGEGLADNPEDASFEAIYKALGVKK